MCEYCASGFGFDLTQHCCRVRITADPKHGGIEAWAKFWRRTVPDEAARIIAEAECQMRTLKCQPSVLKA